MVQILCFQVLPECPPHYYRGFKQVVGEVQPGLHSTRGIHNKKKILRPSNPSLFGSGIEGINTTSLAGSSHSATALLHGVLPKKTLEDAKIKKRRYDLERLHCTLEVKEFCELLRGSQQSPVHSAMLYHFTRLDPSHQPPARSYSHHKTGCRTQPCLTTHTRISTALLTLLRWSPRPPPPVHQPRNIFCLFYYAQRAAPALQEYLGASLARISTPQLYGPPRAPLNTWYPTH